MINALTIDVEDYYNVFARDRLGADGPPSEAVVINTDRIVDMLAGQGVRATFFVLGEVGRSYPELVARIAAAGHELGVHGMRHRQVFKLSPEQFASDAAEAKKIIEDCAGREAPGYRAAAFSIRPDTSWALAVLAEAGFRYDSSIFPISGRRYGWPGFRKDIHELTLPGGGRIVEAPATTFQLPGLALPVCGGGYLRHFPYWVTRVAAGRIGRHRPVIVYMHPYELDVSPPPDHFASALAGADGRTRRFHAAQLAGRGGMRRKLARLLRDFAFAPLGQVIARTLSSPAGSAGSAGSAGQLKG